eukprot:TRINITY_DN13682_c0_g3_i4.p1 TRINITY_DN13682_c0_g3~~TRINITY_DN13682_c0_g3_i4.p1  ORF type:complete len:136 (-),score=29.73 TRINITY_DN13682_c0_g3_i4:108-515(-)
MALLTILIIFSSLSLHQGRAAPEDIHIHLHGLNKQMENGGKIQETENGGNDYGMRKVPTMDRISTIGGKIQESEESGNDYGSVALTEEGTFEECLKNKSKRKCSWEERERKRKHKEWMDCIRNPRIPQEKCFDLN